MKYLTNYLKAHVAGITAALTLILADMSNNPSLGHGGGLTANDWFAIVGAYVGVASAVAVVPNAAPAPAAAVPGAPAVAQDSA